VPFAGMGVSFEAMVFGYKRFVNRRLAGPFFLADGN
jgi:hypothetical protein